MEKEKLASKMMGVIFGSVLGANILSMSIMNFFEMRTALVPVVYLACIAPMILLMFRCRIEYPTLTRKEFLFCGAFASILLLPRISYFFEGVLGYALIPIGDDLFHIPGLASIINTDRFPPRSSYDSSEYLGYYYAAWMPAAVLYHAGLAATIKQSLALLEWAYLFFIVYFAVAASKVLFDDRGLRRTFLVVCFLYGGFDFLYWASSLNFEPRHSEWWANDFGFELQFSNFFTLTLWTPQHFLAALSILFGLYVLCRSEGRLAHALSGLFFLSGVFSSPFSVLGTIPLVLWYVLKSGKLRATLTPAVVFAAVSLPLWWVLIEDDHVGFRFLGALVDDLWIKHSRAAFAVFLLVLTLELGPLIAAATYFVKRNIQWRWPFALSTLYLISTFFCWYHANYSMRGSIVPIFTLVFLATPVIHAWYRSLPPLWLKVVAASFLLGGVLEYASFNKTAILNLGRSDTPFNKAAFESNVSSDKMVSKELIDQASAYPYYGWQLLEKSKPVKKSHITIDEARLMHPDNRYRLTFSSLRRSKD